MYKSYFSISKEVEQALANNQPVVALESTLISHGLPYPKNLDVAKSSLEAVRTSGSVPATIAVINGRVKVGLNDDDMDILATNRHVEKVSMHNLAIAISNKNHAATTVASTIYLASQIGIKFFATGGIGGAHLNSEKTFDISADLNQLSRTSMFIICSGAKSILDLDKTYEILETLGIARIGFKSDFMPGFWYHQTNKKVDYNFNKIEELSNYLKVRDEVNQKGSILIFNPVPQDKAIKKELIERWIGISIEKSQNDLISGKELTPYLIKEINSLSKNKTLEANMALIVNNALLAGQVAAKYFKI